MTKTAVYKSIRWALLMYSGYVTMNVCAKTNVATMRKLVL